MTDPQKAVERATGELFGRLFPAYDDRAFMASVELFKRRFELNDFPLDWFQGKECLDAGCRGGHCSIALSLLGARRVVGIDVSEAVREAIDEVRKGSCTEGDARQRIIGQGHYCVVAWKRL